MMEYHNDLYYLPEQIEEFEDIFNKLTNFPIKYYIVGSKLFLNMGKVVASLEYIENKEVSEKELLQEDEKNPNVRFETAHMKLFNLLEEDERKQYAILKTDEINNKKEIYYEQKFIDEKKGVYCIFVIFLNKPKEEVLDDRLEKACRNVGKDREIDGESAKNQSGI